MLSLREFLRALCTSAFRFPPSPEETKRINFHHKGAKAAKGRKGKMMGVINSFDWGYLPIHLINLCSLRSIATFVALR